MTKQIEQKVAETVLQQPFYKNIGPYTIRVHQASTATLIKVSALISTLPREKVDYKNVINETLRIARKCNVLGDIASTLLLGESNKSIFWLKRELCFGLKLKVPVSRSTLSRLLLESLGAKELNILVVDLLSKMEIADFFGLTISLLEINMLSPTREMVTMTASGQSSQE